MNHIKIFEDYTLNESYPGSEILKTDIKDHLEVIRQHAPWYMENNMSDKFLYRGIKSNADYILVDPKKHHRNPSGSEDDFPLFYDIIMNESDEWKEFCGNHLRNTSIFTTNVDFKTIRYGTIYRVIPLNNNQEFIRTFTSDTYGAFTYMKHRFGVGLPRFSSILMDTLDVEGYYAYFDQKSGRYDKFREEVNNNSDESINELISGMNKMNGNFSRKWEDRLTMDEIKECGSLMGWIDKMLSPTLNQFEKVKYNTDIVFSDVDKYTGMEYDEFELWTSGKCLLVREGLFFGSDALDW